MLFEENIQKIINIEKSLSEKRGNFVFFGMLRRSDLPDGQWDLVASADWVKKDDQPALVELLNRLRTVFGDNQLGFLANVVLLEPREEFIKQITKFVKIEHGKAEIRDSQIGNLRLGHAFIITSVGKKS